MVQDPCELCKEEKVKPPFSLESAGRTERKLVEILACPRCDGLDSWPSMRKT